MDTINDRKGRLGRSRVVKAVVLTSLAALAIAAATFNPRTQPWGYVAPPALSSTNFSKGGTTAYTPWFESSSFHGDLMALPVGTNGTVTLLVPEWRASEVLDLQDWDSDRKIVTTNGVGDAMPFRWDELIAPHQSWVGSEANLEYIRGSRVNEGAGGWRTRVHVLGDIIHSNPTYVGKPKSGYIFGDYLAFADTYANRASRVYVGANDGMLHAFDAVTGEEVFAYIPSMVTPNLAALRSDPYTHQYYVDGFLTAEDVQMGGGWRTVLVGGLSAGGKGYYALNVTTGSPATESAAADLVLWEFNASSPGASNLGYSYGRPSIVRLESGKWAAILSNGYLSATGVASLYVVDIATGGLIHEIITPDMDSNGLSSPTVIDFDSDGYADTAYAGDLNGNIWKFDINAGTVVYGQALFTVPTDGVSQPAITTAPEVGVHPDGGVMVYAGTGRLLAPSDSMDETTQFVMGLWDDGNGRIDPSSLVRQQLYSRTHASGESVRTVSANEPDWDIHRGWYLPTEIEGAGLLDKGERVLQDMTLRDGRITFMTVDPTIASGDNWLMSVDAMTGGGPGEVTLDINGDNNLTKDDNVDGNNDGVIEDVPADRVVGQYQNFGLASRPVAGVVTRGKDAALINHLAAIPPGLTAGDPNDPGLIGGHFDLDTSSDIYGFGGGDTDGHVHEYDDDHDTTSVNFFDLLEPDKLYEIDANENAIPDKNEHFILTVTNTSLSPGGILEINGTSLSVAAYNDLYFRYLSGTLGPGESFPTYKLNPPNQAERDAGVVRLESLKLSFDAYAILSGDLIPTETGCVRGNDIGTLGEYRNGALTLQALNASNLIGGFTLDVPTQRYVANSTSVNAVHGYATTGLYWESTLFWHWSDGCYNETGWADAYQSCIVNGLGGCTEGTTAEQEEKADKKKKKDKDDDPAPPVPGGDPPEGVSDPDHSVTTTTISGADDLGRLFWRELIPEE